MNDYNYDYDDERPRSGGNILTGADLARRLGITTSTATSPKPIPAPPEPHPAERQWSPRTRRVMAAVRSNFLSWEHRPSTKQMQALTEIPEAVNDILEGRRQGELILNEAACGLGKTQILAQCCRDILTNPEDADKSILIAIPRISEIKAFIRSVGPIGDDFAIHVNRGGKTLRQLGQGYEHATDARLLISTQASVRRFIKGRKMMADVDDLLFRGRVRDLRLWDEFLNTAQDIAIRSCTCSRWSVWVG
jgi:hypothetical protein